MLSIAETRKMQFIQEMDMIMMVIDWEWSSLRVQRIIEIFPVVLVLAVGPVEEVAEAVVVECLEELIIVLL